MNDERAMILKMLQEGKISVDEADALLDVLNEPASDADTGFAKADAGSTPPSGSAQRPTDQPGGSRVFVHTQTGPDDDHGEHAGFDHEDEEAPGGPQGPRGPRGPKGRSDHGRGAAFGIDIDLSSLKDSLRDTMGSVREAMEGVSESLRDAFSGLGDIDLSETIGRAMGRVRVDDERELRAASGAEGTLKITNKWGDVRITGTTRDSITGTARIACWDQDEESAREALEATRVDLTGSGSDWAIQTNLGSARATRVDLELQVPRAFGVTVTSASGDLWLEDLTGSQSVNTLSGDVNVASLGASPDAAQQVSTKSGDVVAAALTGEVTLSSMSGDVSVDGFTGTLQATTHSGDIRVTDGHGSVQLKAMSGDIRCGLAGVGTEPVRLTSVSGSAVLELPEGAAVDVVAKSTSGDARVDLELEDREQTDHRVSGSANGGGVSVELSSVSGDVTIRTA